MELQLAILALLTAIFVFAAALVGLIAKLRSEVQQVHVLVNNRMEEALARIVQLSQALQVAGIEPPTPPSFETPPGVEPG